jgi:hypothetical protein
MQYGGGNSYQHSRNFQDYGEFTKLKKQFDEFDEDKSSDTASSKDPKHSELASINDSSSYLNSNRYAN